MKTRILFFTILALLISTTASAYDFTVGGIYYNITDATNKTVAVTYKDANYNSYTGTVVIPSQVTNAGNTYAVTSIGLRAFSNCTGLKSITIPSSVTSLGDFIFYRCTGLKSIFVSWNTPPFANLSTFNLVTVANVCLYIPAGSAANYAAATYWSDFSIKPLTFAVGGINYAITSETTVKVDVSPSATGAITIPSTVTYGCVTFNVTSIVDHAFENCSGLTSVTIPSSIPSIGSYTFADCTGLTSVTIPTSATSIGINAFSGCSKLTSVTIPASVTSIAEGAFQNCSGLTSVTIPTSVANIGAYAFYNCSALTSVAIPSAVTSIADNTFYGCSKLTSVTIPSSITSIGSNAFNGCSVLASVTIPSTVTSIGDGAFQACYGLTSVTIPSSVTSIGTYVFNGCIGLTSVTIPSSVTSIGNYAFQSCYGLTSVTIPNAVTSIGTYVFNGCTGLTSVVIPSSVTSIGSYTFNGCTGLKSVTVSWATPFAINPFVFSGVTTSNVCLYVPAGTDAAYRAAVVWSGFNVQSSSTFSVGGINYAITSATTVKVDATPTATGAVTIPATVTYGCGTFNVTSIGNYAFKNCTGLTSVIIPNSVTSIGYAVFASCTGLTSVTIPNSVTSIGNSVFFGCTGLASIIIPSSVTSIGYEVFGNCSGLTSVTIPNSLTSISDGAFGNCSGLTSVTIPNSVTSIGFGAFINCSGLTSVSIPSSVTSIANNAFQNCTGLQSVTVGWATPLAINSYVFLGVTTANVCLYVPSGKEATYKADAVWGGFNVNSQKFTVGGINYAITSDTSVVVDVTATATGAIVIPATVTYGCKTFNVMSIGDNAFKNCSGLTSVIIPNSVTSIGTNAFSGCKGLTSVIIPNSVTSIGTYAFSSCSGLTSVTISNSVTSIGAFAFIGCTRLASIIIPNSVTGIGDSAFGYCTGLKSVTVNWATPIAISAVVFDAVTTSNVCLYVPVGKEATYGAAAIWKGFNIRPPTFAAGGINYAITSETSVKVDVTASATGAIVIPSTVSSGCKTFDVTSIGDNAFQNCSGLTSVTIPNSITSIGDNAFKNCSGLTSVTIPNSVTSIGTSAFESCSGLTSVTIPNSVTSIGDYAFSGCTGLQSVTVNWTTPLAINANVFSGITTANVCLYIPAGTATAYSADAVWGGFNIKLPTFAVAGINYTTTSDTTVMVDATPSATGAISIPATISNGCKTFSVTSIGDEAFYNCTGLTAVTIPTSVTSIGIYAFSGCTDLTSVTIPNSVTSIGIYAFSLSALTSFAIPNSVTSIGGGTFAGCSSLTSVTIPNSVTSIGSFAFSNCSSLTSVTIPNSVTSIGSFAFASCTSLQSVTIPNSVTSIGYYAFGNCTGLTSVTIPNSVTSIGDYAFQDCTGLQSVFVSWATPLAINANVFDSVTTANVNLYVPSGTEAIYDATPVWTDFIISVTSVFANVKALLKGPLNGTTMSTTLNTANLIPKVQPYNTSPWNYAGIESVTTIPTNATDWVLIELRDATTPNTVVATRAAFILSDGSIVDVDGVSPVEFTDIAAGNYHIAVKHRNHLAIRTATAQALGATVDAALYDFTTAQTQANGTNPMVKSGTVYAMWSGDVNSDGNVYNTASPQDASQVVNGVANKTGNTFHLPSYGGYKSVYNNLDVNMDGNVFNTATPQDASNIVNNVANAPGNTFHLPSYSGLKAKL